MAYILLISTIPFSPEYRLLPSLSSRKEKKKDKRKKILSYCLTLLHKLAKILK